MPTEQDLGSAAAQISESCTLMWILICFSPSGNISPPEELHLALCSPLTQTLWSGVCVKQNKNPVSISALTWPTAT